MVVISVLQKTESTSGCITESEISCMHLNTRVSKKKHCLFGKCRGIRHLLFVSALKIPKLSVLFVDTMRCGWHYWWLGLTAVVVWCTLLYISEDAYCVRQTGCK